MDMSKEKLYGLLPRIYRRRDLDRGQPLRALTAILENQYQLLEDDIRTLYDNWFIETCEEWCIPYIADLLGIRGLTASKKFPGAWRSLVANTVAFRRRKGTVATLANVVRDATGWKTTAIEFFKRLSMTQSLDDIRLNKGKTADVRDQSVMGAINSPFDTAAHTVNIRGGEFGEPGYESPVPYHIPDRGNYNIPDIGIFLWRLESYPVVDADARSLGSGRYTFNPFGLDAPLFNLPETQIDNAQVPAQANLPIMLRRRGWPWFEKESAGEDSGNIKSTGKSGQVSGTTRQLMNRQVFEIAVKDTRVEDEQDYKILGPDDLYIGNLDRWNAPVDVEADDSLMAAVDPELGRILFLRRYEPEHVKISYCYGFSGDKGGGPYRRPVPFPLKVQDRVPWIASVGKELTPGHLRFNTIDDALEAWEINGKNGTVRIVDNAAYELNDFHLSLDENQRLIIEAAQGHNPCLRGDLDFQGIDVTSHAAVSGLWIDGSIKISGAMTLDVTHCTLCPNTAPSIAMAPEENSQSHAVKVIITHSITGPLQLSPGIDSLEVYQSIIDGLGKIAVSEPFTHTPNNPRADFGPPAKIEKSTVLGGSRFTRLTGANDTLFTAPVMVKDLNTGFMRFCYVPEGSRTPVQYQCQTGKPELESTLFFNSSHYAQPRFAQLSHNCPKKIKTGAENGAEIGAFNTLYQPQREENLKAILQEYFPTGMKPGVFYVS